jgi:hypothetical protein
MSQFMKILGVATKVVTFLSVTVVAAISLFSAYIIFAPDDLPKPFHLNYIYPTPVVTPGVADIVPTATVEPLKPGDGIMFNMSTKIINLADSGARKYIRLTMVLEFAPDNPEYTNMSAEEQKTYLTTFQDKINARMPLLDDIVITLISTKAFDDLYTAAGKEALRQELMQSIATKLPDHQLISVYFTEFVVQ